MLSKKRKQKLESCKVLCLYILQIIIIIKLMLKRTLKVWLNNHLMKRSWIPLKDLISYLSRSQELRWGYNNRDTASLNYRGQRKKSCWAFWVYRTRRRSYSAVNMGYFLRKEKMIPKAIQKSSGLPCPV